MQKTKFSKNIKHLISAVFGLLLLGVLISSAISNGNKLNYFSLNKRDSVITRNDEISSKYGKPVIEAPFGINALRIALWQLAQSCQDWSNGDNGAVAVGGCIYGAISTLVTIAGAGWAGYAKGTQIKKAVEVIRAWSRAIGFKKRDITDIATHVLTVQSILTNITGLPHSILIDYNHEPLFSKFYDGGLLYTVNNSAGVPVLGSIKAYNNGSHDLGRIYHGFLNQSKYENNGKRKRGEQFNEQDFTSGGLEMTFLFNDADHGILSTSNDYGTIDHQVSCVLNGLPNNMFEFQILDNNHRGTIAGGNIRGFTDEPYDEDRMDHISAGLAPRQECEVS
ncbi:hypothetical protein KGF56_002838 [Candida oxycetoniae]|uniref:Uncharacterized protein n=1 Tax=Candida oxycetoniae TaxID=497107 RepID=A0AAI9WXQ6_9ASCO|nr:uncharacterized protein KGF56_002838 [Candida oxycetoniae]KAI3404318.2 hypothetical protein KGF56_002838 [Candida oxycetoniae]